MNHDEAAGKIVLALLGKDFESCDPEMHGQYIFVVTATLKELDAFPEVPADLEAAVRESVDKLYLGEPSLALEVKNLITAPILSAVAPLLAERDKRIKSLEAQLVEARQEYDGMYAELMRKRESPDED